MSVSVKSAAKIGGTTANRNPVIAGEVDVLAQLNGFVEKLHIWGRIHQLC